MLCKIDDRVWLQGLWRARLLPVTTATVSLSHHLLSAIAFGVANVRVRRCSTLKDKDEIKYVHMYSPAPCAIQVLCTAVEVDNM